jgi:hypothetical protein
MKAQAVMPGLFFVPPFLRGINVGGHKPVPKQEPASGNVLFRVYRCSRKAHMNPAIPAPIPAAKRGQLKGTGAIC